MSAPNKYKVSLHGLPKGVTGVRTGDQFVYAPEMKNAPGLNNQCGDKAPPNTILTVTEIHFTDPDAYPHLMEFEDFNKVQYKLCSLDNTFKEWFNARELVYMINTRQLRKVPQALHRPWRAFGRG